MLLDERGSGTDPAEGMGIAIAVLDELRRRNCLFLVTTHYPQVKTYAESAESVQSARMAFDEATLAPLYRLEMGKSGESCALHIASRLGLAPYLLKGRSHEVVRTPIRTGQARMLARAAGRFGWARAAPKRTSPPYCHWGQRRSPAGTRAA